jgi:hypothetical protein
MRKICLVAGALLVCVSPAHADVVVDWNIVTAQTIAAASPPRRGPSSVFDFAMVHAAMHDAVQAYEARYESYCGSPYAEGSPIAAAAAAAHRVLVASFPAQAATLDAALAASLTTYGVTGDAGILVGRQAADCVLVRLAADNAARAVPDAFIGGTGIGEWRSTLATPAPITAEFIATFQPFALKEPSQFRAAQGPPKLTSGAYAKAYNEVKSLGALNGSTRTEEQTKMARFFSDAPPNYWYKAVRGLVDARSLDLGESARLFALVSLSLADAIITAWDSKIAWNFWRPSTAIHEGHYDGNPRTDGDEDWQPFFANPNYPDYTSGANNASGAAATAIANFFGTDDVEFTLTSVTIPAPDNVRHYTKCSDAQRDVVDARIYMGIHFRFADTVALHQGRHVANWVHGHYLRPLD